MKLRPLAITLAVLAAAAVGMLALLVYAQRKEAAAVKSYPVYVNADKLMKIYNPDFLVEAFNDLPPEEHINENISDVPVELNLKLEPLNYVHDTSEFEKYVAEKLTLEKEEQLERVMSVMDASAELAVRRNVSVGLLQLNPYFDEYDSVGMEKLRRIFEENNNRKFKSQAKLGAAATKIRIFDNDNSRELLESISAEASLDKKRNEQLFYHYMSVSEQFKEQEVNKVINELTDKLNKQVADAKADKLKKYDGYIDTVKELFNSHLYLDRKTSVIFYNMPSVSFSAVNAKKTHGPIKEQISNDEIKRRELSKIIHNIADEMGVEAVFEPKKGIPDFTDTFCRKLNDSWQFNSGLIIDMED